MTYTAIINNEVFENCYILQDPSRLCLPMRRSVLIASFSRYEIYKSWVKNGFLKEEGVKMSVKGQNGKIIKDFSVE